MSTYLLYALGNQKIHLTHFIVIFVLLLWSGAQPTISLTCACPENAHFKKGGKNRGNVPS